MTAVEVPQYEEISGGGKNGERKGVGSALHRGNAKRGSMHIEERKKERKKVSKWGGVV